MGTFVVPRDAVKGEIAHAAQRACDEMNDGGGEAGAPFSARLEQWFASPRGQAIITEETACIRPMLSDRFGYVLLQMGLVSEFGEIMTATRIHNRVCLGMGHEPLRYGEEILAAPERLPIETESVDLVFMPHTLDFATSPQQVLREVERVLIANGRVLILGFNPLSTWGLWRLVRNAPGRIPWCARFVNPLQVTGWLSELGLSIEIRSTALFRLPWRLGPSRRVALAERLYRAVWPFFGGVYAIRAVKRIAPLTPIRPLWPHRHPIIGGRMEPTPHRGAPPVTRRKRS